MSASENIDKQIAELGDWRGERMEGLRTVISGASPELTEDWKWGTAVWTSNGNVCALDAFKDHVKVNFFNGAHLGDPRGLFNSGLDAKESRSVELREGDTVDTKALQGVVQAAVAYNASKR